MRFLYGRIILASLVALGLGSTAFAVEPLAGTKPLELEGDLASTMVDGIDKFLLEELAASVDSRGKRWARDLTSTEKYVASVAPNRARLAKILGVVEAREPFVAPELVTTTSQSALIAQADSYEVYAIRWPVLRGVTGEGLLLKPKRETIWGDVIALPDADQTPEMLVGLVPGVPPEAQFARRLAESGCRVIVPTLIDRADTWSSGAGGTRPTNQPHREFIYRQAFEMGRHVIGYEVQKVLALVDWLSAEAAGRDPLIGVYGYAEGGLLALAAGALDTRIDVTCSSGYFDSRQNVWEEPIYRNVFGFLHEFGDAELASLIAPRMLIVEASVAPAITGPPAVREGAAASAAPGRIATPVLASVQEELTRARNLLNGLGRMDFALVASGDGTGQPGCDAALNRFLAFKYDPAGIASVAAPGATASVVRIDDAAIRQKRQVEQLTEFSQHLVRESEYVRRDFWAKADRASRLADKWKETTAGYRQHFYDEVIGRFDQPLLEANAKSRKVYDEAKYTGYEVVLDVLPNVMAYGILLVPKDLKEGEKRPVVVCQHGLEGRPQDVAQPGLDVPAYHNFAGKLAERGFITFSPQNPYIFQDRFRTFNRKGNPLKKTLFSLIVPQHQQIVGWLAGLPMVDPERIAFYGLSYGGKTAMRVPAIVEKYCLSICSADFNEWIWKNTSTRSNYSYVPTGEYEIFEFDLGQTYNYAEMAGLIAPRPFMVERGHRDGVAPDEWVAYEYAKVRLLYADLMIPERTTIEFFDGPHTINGVGTFDFLHKHLNWPVPQ